MARIERRQGRLRRLRSRFQTASGTTPNIEPPPLMPDAHHHIGKSQNEYEGIGTFLSKHMGDPAVQVFSSLSRLAMQRLIFGCLGFPPPA